MSFSSLRLPGLSLLVLLSACTAQPLYAPAALDPATGAGLTVASLAGRVQVSEAGNRTAQVVRNPLIFRLNGGQPVQSPLYEVELIVSANDQAVSIEEGSGIPTASLYRIDAEYRLLRLPGREVLASGRRSATAPYDRSGQLFASQRALLDARENAGRTLADTVAASLAPVLRREIAPGSSPVVAPVAPR